MTTPQGSTARNPLAAILPLAIAGLGAVGFIVGFLRFAGQDVYSFSGFESGSPVLTLVLVVGALGLAAALSKTVSAWPVAAVAVAMFLVQVGQLIAGLDGRAYGFWLLLVVAVLQAAAAVVYVLVEAGVLKLSPKPAATASYGGYGQPGQQGQYGPPDQGGYGQPGQGGQGQYGQPSPGYAAPSPTPTYGQPTGGGYGQPAPQQPSQGGGYGQPAPSAPAPQQPAAPSSPGGYGQPAPSQPSQTAPSGSQSGGYGQYGNREQGGGGGRHDAGQSGATPPPQPQPGQGTPPPSQPWQSPNT